MNESRALAEFVSRLRYEDLPQSVVEKTKELILDQLGVALGASTLPWSRIIEDYVRDWGGVSAESTVLNFGYKTKLENAVFANCSFGHGFEYDDVYIAGNSHPGCIVTPTALAAGERERVCGRDLIVAVVAGYEVMGRINAALAPSCAMRGFHAPTSVSGPFGAAAAVGKTLQFDVKTMLDALAIAGSHASGVTEYDQSGGSVKRMHAGMAAHGGVRSALLARKGLTGPAAILEGKHGVFRAFADAYHPDRIVDGLGGEFKVIMDTGLKAYCACAPIHAAIDAVHLLRTEQAFVAEEIESIVMGTNRRSISHVAAPPTDILSAQFSAAFSLALTVVRGSNGFDDYTEQTLKDPRILKLAEKVRLRIDEDIDAIYPATRGARVTIRLSSGARLEARVDHCKGSPHNPLSRADLESKFRQLAEAAVAPAHARQAIERIWALDDERDLVGLIGCLVAA